MREVVLDSRSIYVMDDEMADELEAALVIAKMCDLKLYHHTFEDTKTNIICNFCFYRGNKKVLKLNVHFQYKGKKMIVKFFRLEDCKFRSPIKVLKELQRKLMTI